jgi:hypothetical protein
MGGGPGIGIIGVLNGQSAARELPFNGRGENPICLGCGGILKIVFKYRCRASGPKNTC